MATLDENSGAAVDEIVGQTAAGDSRKLAGRIFIARFGSLIFFAVLVIALGVHYPSFRTWGNFTDIVATQTFLTLMAFGLTILLSLGEFDLSVGYVASLAAVVGATVAQHHQSTWLGFGLGMLVAVGCGLANGLIVTVIRIPSFMATLATGIVFYGLTYAYGSGAEVIGMPANFAVLGQDSVAGVRWVTLITAIALLVGWLLLERSVTGRHMYAVGGQSLAARLSGINLTKVRIAGFVCAAVGAGLSGLLLASNQVDASPLLATGLLLDAFTAVFLGASIVRGKPHLVGTAIAAIMLGVLDNGMTLMNLDVETTSIVRGVVLLSAIALSQLAAPSES
jgi:ribose transport system permease protein